MTHPQTTLSQSSSSHLDYTLWNSPSATPETRLDFIQQLRECLVGIGFFYLHNSPLDQDGRRERVFQSTKKFFELPIEIRASIGIENSRHFRGYTKFGDETTQDKVDHRDQIDFGPEASPIPWTSKHSSHPFSNLVGPNQFVPSSILPDQREIILDWFKTSNQLCLDLTEALEEALGVEEGRLGGYLEASKEHEEEMKYGRMKVIRYPVDENVDGTQRLGKDQGGNQGVGAHKDGGWLTLLSTSSVQGLEVQDFKGNWISVPQISNATIVNFGQQLEFVCRSSINAATHRVISNTSGEDRLSVAWFGMPRLDVKIQELGEDELGDEFKKVWKEEKERRKKEGVEKVKTDVKDKDLHSEGKYFGEIAWEGLRRSHRNVVERWYT